MTAPHNDDHPTPAGPEPSAPGRPTAWEHHGPPATEEPRVEPTGIPPSTDGPDRPQDLPLPPGPAAERGVGGAPGQPANLVSASLAPREESAGAEPPSGPEPDGTAPSEPDDRHGEGATTNGADAGLATTLRDASAAVGRPRGPGGPPHPDAEIATALGDEPDAVGFGGPPEGADVWPTDEALEAVDLDDAGWTRRDLEAILLVADEPVPATTLAELVGARLTQVESMLIDLAGEYAAQGRGFVLRAVAGGWRLYTHPSARDVVEAYLRAGTQSRLTRAALETLAVVAYRQPVTRHQVAAVRGVNVDGVFRTLTTRGLIHEVGHEEGPGQAVLYGTTPAFLEQLGLNSLDQLPPIKDYLPEGVDLMELLEQM